MSVCVERNSGRKAVVGASVRVDVVSASFNVPMACEHLCYKPSLLALY